MTLKTSGKVLMATPVVDSACTSLSGSKITMEYVMTDKLRTALIIFIIFIEYCIVGTLDFADAQRMSCADRYPDTYFATTPDAVCQSLVP